MPVKKLSQHGALDKLIEECELQTKVNQHSQQMLATVADALGSAHNNDPITKVALNGVMPPKEFPLIPQK